MQVHIDNFIDQPLEYSYDLKNDVLKCDGLLVYSKGKFATIIPQEEPKTENNELVNSSNEIKDIIVVDFENVSQKENPQ